MYQLGLKQLKVKVLILLTLFCSFIIFAQEDLDTGRDRVDETTLRIHRDGGTPTPEAEDISGASLGITDYLFVIFILIVVIAVLYLVLKFIKKNWWD